jgi:hypothetical protein
MTKKKAQSLPLAALALAQPRPPRPLAPSIPLPPRPRPLSPSSSLQLIDFYSEALRRLHPRLTILDAAAAHLARCGGAAAIAGPLGLGAAASILIPLNNADPGAAPPADGATAVGSHWSLLAFHRGSWRHFDSAPGAGGNEAAARGLVRELTPWAGGADGSAAAAAAAAAPRYTGPSPAAPAQANGADCGLHACLAARAVAGVLLGGGEDGAAADWCAADAAVAAAATHAAAAAARRALRQCVEATVGAGAAAREAGWVPPGLP